MHVFSRMLLLVFLVPVLGFSGAGGFLPLASVVGARVYDVGYFIKRGLLDDVFFHYPLVTKQFAPAKLRSPYTIEPETLLSFESMISSVEHYIDDQKKGIMIHCEENPEKCSTTFSSMNGISERELAQEIVKSSYCFGTDPFLVTSKIRQESRFDMSAISQTGAIGLTQLTNPGLKEILDQMGQRGEKYAYVENNEFITEAIQCYTQDDIAVTMKDLPKIQVITTKSGGLEYSADTLVKLKAWLLPSKNPSHIYDKHTYIQRQIFMGQILLKIYLAYSKKARPTQATLRHYDNALKMFNGDDIQVKYAKDVIRFSKQVQSL